MSTTGNFPSFFVGTVDECDRFLEQFAYPTSHKFLPFFLTPHQWLQGNLRLAVQLRIYDLAIFGCPVLLVSFYKKQYHHWIVFTRTGNTQVVPYLVIPYLGNTIYKKYYHQIVLQCDLQDNKSNGKAQPWDTVFLETTANHGLNVLPFYHPLNVYRGRMLQVFSKHDRIHLFILELAITIMHQLVLIGWNKWRMN